MLIRSLIMGLMISRSLFGNVSESSTVLALFQTDRLISRMPQGTRDGGGDITRPQRKVFSRQEVEGAIDEAARLLPQFFALLQIAPMNATRFHCGTAKDACYEVFNLVRSRELSDRITERLPSIRFVKQDQPCGTGDGKPSDASVAHQSGGNVCLSVSRLEAKLNQSRFNQDNAFVELLALLAHESLHKFGISSEPNARLFQVAIVDALKRSPVFNPKLPIAKIPVEYASIFQSHPEDSQKSSMDRILALADRLATAKDPCFKANELPEQIEAIVDEFSRPESSAAGFIQPVGFQNLRAALSIAANRKAVCFLRESGSTESPTEYANRMRRFAGLPEMASIPDEADGRHDFQGSLRQLIEHLQLALAGIGSPFAKSAVRP